MAGVPVVMANISLQEIWRKKPRKAHELKR
jgi:hypothetical protein